MEKWQGKVAIVTGASAGIGAALCKALVEKGMKVAGLARRVERVEELASKLKGPGKLYACKCDVTNENEVLKTFKWICENVGPVHVLTNNAGLTKPTSLADGNTEYWRNVLDVNVISVCICTREALRIMKANNIEGHIIHLNSILGHKVIPFKDSNVYAASKHAVTALTETLKYELKEMGSKTRISSISPGYVKTEFQENVASDLKGMLDKMTALNPEDIAEAAVYILSTPPHVQIQDIIILPN